MRATFCFSAIFITRALQIGGSLSEVAPLSNVDLFIHQDDDIEQIPGFKPILEEPLEAEILIALNEGSEKNQEEKEPKIHPKFETPYDHEGHQKDVVLMDKWQTNFSKNVTLDGVDYCHLHDWAIVTWKAWSIDTDKPTRKLKEESPAAFQLGHYQVSKCWEIAIHQMRAGESATITCPAYLVDQSIDEAEGENQGRKYFLEVQECSPKPAFLQKPLKKDTCFYMRHVDTNLAVTVDVNQMYKKNIGLWNIRVAPYESGNKGQQWIYKNENLNSVLHPGKMMLEGFNRNLVAYKSIGKNRNSLNFKQAKEPL